DRERGDARCGQRLHLDAGLVHRTHACLDRENTAVVVAERHVDTGETKRMAERDQLVGTLGRQDAGGARDAQHITLGRVAGTDDLKRLRRHTQDGGRHRLPGSLGLGGNVDHAGVAAGREMTEAPAPRSCAAPRHRDRPEVSGPASGRDARVPEDTLHAVFGHELELLELGDPPLLFRRERGDPLECLELAIVKLMLVAKAAKLLVLGDQSVDEALLGHAWPPCGGRDRCKTSKASVPVAAGFVMALINNATPVRCSWLRVTVYSLRPAWVSRKPHEVAVRIKWTALALKMAITA